MEPIDTITLKDACETPLWKMVWAGEPNRRIAVYMTYDDLMRLCDVDFVQVVRCKDCSACMEFAPEYKNDGYYGTCRRLLFIVLDNDDAKVKADGYCNYGRRKEG